MNSDQQDEAKVLCPYCGEGMWILIDTSVEEQRYVEDCQICCRPMDLLVRCLPGRPPGVTVRHEDDV
jgi:hypothetical protein